MIFFAVSHSEEIGTVYVGGEFQLTHRQRNVDGTPVRTVRINRSGREIWTLAGDGALVGAMRMCERLSAPGVQ